MKKLTPQTVGKPRASRTSTEARVTVLKYSVIFTLEAIRRLQSELKVPLKNVIFIEDSGFTYIIPTKNDNDSFEIKKGKSTYAINCTPLCNALLSGQNKRVFVFSERKINTGEGTGFLLIENI